MTPWEKHLATKRKNNLVVLELPEEYAEAIKNSRLTEEEFKRLYFGKPYSNEFKGLHSRIKNK